MRQQHQFFNEINVPDLFFDIGSYHIWSFSHDFGKSKTRESIVAHVRTWWNLYRCDYV